MAAKATTVMYGPVPPTHLMTLVPWIGGCGARRQEGARLMANRKFVTCAECIRISDEKRAEAKARFAAAGGLA